jgi:hypothetical protein
MTENATPSAESDSAGTEGQTDSQPQAANEATAPTDTQPVAEKPASTEQASGQENSAKEPPAEDTGLHIAKI